LSPFVQDPPIDPARDLNPLGGSWVLDGIRRILAREVWAIGIEGVRIAGSLRRERVLPDPPSLRAGAHRTDGCHEADGEDPQADGQSLEAGRSGVSDNHGLDLQREAAVISSGIIATSHPHEDVEARCERCGVPEDELAMLAAGLPAG
jgi:hypothetical protein